MSGPVPSSLVEPQGHDVDRLAINVLKRRKNRVVRDAPGLSGQRMAGGEFLGAMRGAVIATDGLEGKPSQQQHQGELT